MENVENLVKDYALSEVETEGLVKVKHLKVITRMLIQSKADYLNSYYDSIKDLDPEISLESLIRMSLFQIKTTGVPDFDIINTWFVLTTYIHHQLQFYLHNFAGLTKSFNVLNQIESELSISTKAEGCPLNFESLGMNLRRVESALKQCVR